MNELYVYTKSKKVSVTDKVVRTEQRGIISFAGWQSLRHKFQIGAHGARETPVPIPNTAVKPRSGYNTWGSPLGK